MQTLNIYGATIREVDPDYLIVTIQQPATMRSLLAPMLSAMRDLDVASNLHHVFGLTNDTMLVMRKLGHGLTLIGLESLDELQVLDSVNLMISVDYSKILHKWVLLAHTVVRVSSPVILRDAKKLH